MAKTVDLGSADSLKIVLTAKEGSTGKRPHQAFLSIQDPSTGLETAFPFDVKENGIGKVDMVGVPLHSFISPEAVLT